MLKRTVEFAVSVLVLVALGAGLYYADREWNGGQVLGGNGFVRNLFAGKVNPPGDGPRPDFAGGFVPGPLRHKFEVRNASRTDLSGVQVTLEFHTPAGVGATVSETVGEWKADAVKTFEVPAQGYTRVTMKGTAAGGAVIDGEWRWDAPVATPPVGDFGITFDYGPVTHVLKLTNTAADGNLTAVEVTAKLTAESGVVNEVKLAFDSWNAGEEKRVKVPSEKYRSAALVGKAKLGGQDVRVEKTVTWSKPYRPGIGGLRGAYDRADRPTRFEVTNGSPDGDLSNVTLTLTLTWPDDTSVEIAQKVPRWGAGETLSFTVRKKAPRVTLTGTARTGGVEVLIDTTWGAD